MTRSYGGGPRVPELKRLRARAIMVTRTGGVGPVFVNDGGWQR